MDLSSYGARAAKVVQGFKAEDRTEAEEAEKLRQLQLEQQCQKRERLEDDHGWSL